MEADTVPPKSEWTLSASSNSSCAEDADNKSQRLHNRGYKEAVCITCGKIGHLSHECKSNVDNNQEAALPTDDLPHSIVSLGTAKVLSTKNTEDPETSIPESHILKEDNHVSVRKKVPLLPKFLKSSVLSSSKKIHTETNIAYSGITLIDSKSSKSLEKSETSSCYSPPTQTDEVNFVGHSFDDEMTKCGCPSSPPSKRDQLKKEEVDVSKMEETGADGTVSSQTSKTRLKLSSGHTHISTETSPISQPDATPPHSKYKVKVSIKPKFKISQSMEDITLLTTYLEAPQVSPTSTGDISTFYTKIKNKPTNDPGHIRTKTNIAYVDFHRLTKKNSKSLEKLESSSDLSLAQTAGRNYRRHSLLEESINKLHPGVPVPFEISKSAKKVNRSAQLGKQEKEKVSILSQTYKESSSTDFKDFLRSSDISTSLQSLDISTSMTTEPIQELQEDSPLTTDQREKESLPHTYEMIDKLVEPLQRPTLVSHSAEVVSPEDEFSSSSSVVSPSSSLSPIKKKTPFKRRGGTKISIMLSKLNKKVHGNASKLTSAIEHLSAMSSPQSRRQRTVIEKYRFTGELGFGIRLKTKPNGPREEPPHWTNIRCGAS